MVSNYVAMTRSDSVWQEKRFRLLKFIQKFLYGEMDVNELVRG